MVAGRQVIVGGDDRGDGAWIYPLGDVLVEIRTDDPSAAATILSALP